MLGAMLLWVLQVVNVAPLGNVAALKRVDEQQHRQEALLVNTRERSSWMISRTDIPQYSRHSIRSSGEPHADEHVALADSPFPVLKKRCRIAASARSRKGAQPCAKRFRCERHATIGYGDTTHRIRALSTNARHQLVSPNASSASRGSRK